MVPTSEDVDMQVKSVKEEKETMSQSAIPTKFSTSDEFCQIQERLNEKMKEETVEPSSVGKDIDVQNINTDQNIKVENS